MSKNATHVRGQKPQINHLSANYIPCLFPNDHGNQSEWIISDQYLVSKSDNDMILIAIDRLTKMAHFIPTTTKVTAKETAELFLRYIFQYHDLPDNIVSDRDPKFTSHFWKNLQKILGNKSPHVDGRTSSD